MEGIHKSFAWVDEANYLTLDDFDKYIRRLNALPIQVRPVLVMWDIDAVCNVSGKFLLIEFKMVTQDVIGLVCFVFLVLFCLIFSVYE